MDYLSALRFSFKTKQERTERRLLFLLVDEAVVAQLLGQLSGLAAEVGVALLVVRQRVGVARLLARLAVPQRHAHCHIDIPLKIIHRLSTESKLPTRNRVEQALVS